MKRVGKSRLRAVTISMVILGALVCVLALELAFSPIQALLFTRLTDGFGVSVEPGPHPTAYYPDSGPYDERLGYTQIPAFLRSFEEQGYKVERQARLSPGLKSFVDLGGFPVYAEKSQAGLSIYDSSSRELYRARHPERVFSDFHAIPPVVVATLLFIENRELLDHNLPIRNPAVEWDRLAAAAVNALVSPVIPTNQHFGGSTLATQLEKFRHSPEGLTSSPADKLRQIASASARAYVDGADTTQARKRIILDYLNSTPLSARGGFGEVIGLGDGLHVWFGTDLDEVSARLADLSAPASDLARSADIYKQVLSLLLAQRRPSYYLLSGREELGVLTDKHLRLLADAGIVGMEVRDAALERPLTFRPAAPAPAESSFVERKALNSIRADLRSLFQVEGFYDLDRLDIRVEATLDTFAQRNVTEALRRLDDPGHARKAGLVGKSLLRRDPSGVAYSVTLYERGQYANLVRVQADNLERPLDLNEGGKLDLGSTAKLRTLTTYLEIVALLHNRYASVSAMDLRRLANDARDPLTEWALEHLARTSDRSLQGMLEAAMMRRYSGHPATFFTGRGEHSFGNANKSHNRVMNVWEGFRHSANLVFIRMMWEIVRYYQNAEEEPMAEILEDPAHPARRQYLARFADMEGSVFINRFYKRYRNLNPDDALDRLATRAGASAHRLAAVFRTVRPEATQEELAGFIRQRHPSKGSTDEELRDLYDKYGPGRFNLHERGYIAGVHPLELWMVKFLQDRPQATRREVLASSVDERQEAYRWLFERKRKASTNSRIRIIAEEDAFKKVHASWRRQGYPFASLVPSLATAIGSSADRPAALAELMGIILNDGLRLPTVHVDSIHIAEDTPYETHLTPAADRGERVLPREVAVVLRRALQEVVASGTARRLLGTFTDANGKALTVGGKTGTGDELIERYGPGTSAGKTKEVSRSAAFAFFIGDRFFGVITAHVPGPNVDGHRFTSALPTQVLGSLEPALGPVLRGEPTVPIPERGQLLADNVQVEPPGRADAAERPKAKIGKAKASINRARHLNTSRQPAPRRAPRVIDELF